MFSHNQHHQHHSQTNHNTLNNFIKDMQVIRQMEPYLLRLEKEYSDSVGLSEKSLGNSHSDTLPLNPKALINSLSHQKSVSSHALHAAREQERRKMFFEAIQGQTFSISSDQLESMVKEADRLEEETDLYQKEIEEMNSTLKAILERTEKSQTSLSTKIEAIQAELDAIEVQESYVSRIQNLTFVKHRYTNEEARSLMEQQEADFREINVAIERRKEMLTQLEWQKEDEEKTLKKSTARLSALEEEARVAVRLNSNRDQMIEKRLAWATHKLETIQEIACVEEVVNADSTVLDVQFNGPGHEKLQIIISPETAQVFNAKVDILDSYFMDVGVDKENNKRM
ncbi:hypothetical protein BDF14DRAFT_1771173 [Spinellus fusiger]|nr:hypothetical protein BDF14DRAFT_1771173 [Spinellus fusiger]